MARILAYYFDLDLREDDTLLHEWATELLGMVAADATEVNLGGYLVALEDKLKIEGQTKRHRRAVCIALWHVAKCALVREEKGRAFPEDRFIG
jgi:hypothetical protein